MPKNVSRYSILYRPDTFCPRLQKPKANMEESQRNDKTVFLQCFKKLQVSTNRLRCALHKKRSSEQAEEKKEVVVEAAAAAAPRKTGPHCLSFPLTAALLSA